VGDTALTERKALSIVVTGASRGPGLAVVRKLASAGHKVAGVAGSNADAAAVRAAGGLPVFADETRGSELTSLVKMTKADVVVDLARQDLNQTLRNGAWNASELIARANAVAQAARDGGAKFLVATSYAFVYGDTHGHEVSEADKPETNGHPLLKAVVKAEKTALNGGVPACVLRLGYLYGAHMSQMQEATHALRQGRPVPTGSGLANYLYDEDAAEAIRRAVEAQPAGEIINVTDGHPVTSANFLAAVASTMGIRAPGALPGFLNGFLSGSPLKDLFGLSSRVNIAKAEQVLGWTPRYSLNAGLSDTFLSMRAEAAQR
jgi:nucleoside-diphosphate-sugar epimerase